jgi:MFS family permease
VAIPLIGRVSDLIGRQRAFLISLLIFMAGSLLCATADTLGDLVWGRAVQGFGGGGLLPVAIALAGDTLGRRGQLAGIGFVSAVETIGWILGPIYGAAVTGIFSNADQPWKWVFWLNIPVLLVLMFFLRSFTSASQPKIPGIWRNLDLPGSLLLTIALVAANLALASGGEFGAATGTGVRAMGGTHNPLSSQIPLLLAIAVVAVVLLVLWERRTTSPLLPVALYRERPFRATIVANLCVGAVLMVTMVNIPVITALTSDGEDVATLSALLLAPYTIAVASSSLMATKIGMRFGERQTLVIGVLLAALGAALVGLLQDRSNHWTLLPGLLIGGFGTGLLLPALGTIPIMIAGVKERGAAASSALMFRLLGMTVGVSALTSLAVRRLQSLSNQVEPITRAPDESTASFLARQQTFILDHAIPLSIQVIEETFLVAAVIALVMLIPLRALGTFLDKADKDNATSPGQ